jgi:hypothetical protein
VALLLGLAALNPDAWIARQNLDRYEATGKVDWTYLTGLSADAVPVLVELGDRAECAIDPEDLEEDDLLEWNLGRARGRDHIEAYGGDLQLRTGCSGQTTR